LNLKKDYSEVFQKNDIDGDVLKNLTQATLKEMGINLIGDLVRLQNGIEKLNKNFELSESKMGIIKKDEVKNIENPIKEINVKNEISEETPKNTPESRMKIPDEKNREENIENLNVTDPNLTLCFVYQTTNGASTVAKFIAARSNKSIKNIFSIKIKQLDCPEETTEEVRFETMKEDYISKSSCVVVFLTKNCFQCQSLLSVLKFTLEKKKRIILIHDTTSCEEFPQITELEKDERTRFVVESRVFDSIAITLRENDNVECWNDLVDKLYKTNISIIGENIETDIFLSHKQRTGQGIAHALYISLTGEPHKKKVFLDVRTEFDLHDLKLLISKTKLFVFIMTDGILDSYYCFEEFETASNLEKPILLLYSPEYKPPKNLPNDSKWKKYEKILLHYKIKKYNAQHHNKFVDKIVKVQNEKTNKVN